MKISSKFEGEGLKHVKSPQLRRMGVKMWSPQHWRKGDNMESPFNWEGGGTHYEKSQLWMKGKCVENPLNWEGGGTGDWGHNMKSLNFEGEGQNMGSPPYQNFDKLLAMMTNEGGRETSVEAQ